MKNKEMFEKDGLLVVKNLVNKEFAKELHKDLEQAIKKEQDYFSENIPNFTRFDEGMVHNTFLYSDRILSILEVPQINDTLEEIFCRNSIVYAFQSSSAPGAKSNYGRRVHVDAPRLIRNHVTNVGLIIALNDFTKENGATNFLRGSHIIEEQPSEDYFNKNQEYFECDAGDALFFNARLWHRTGINRTQQTRHALTINFCRPYMKSRFDFPRLMERRGIKINHDSIIARFLGYWTRIPTDLDEFYVSERDRLYRAGLE